MRRTLWVSLLALGLTGCRDAVQQVSEPELPEGGFDEPRPFEPSASTIYFKSLRDYLPDALPGFQQLREGGSTGKYGRVSVSEAEREFGLHDGRKLAIRIVDTSVSENLGTKITAAVAEAMRRGASDPTFPIVLAEAIGVVRYDADESRAEANLWVGNRFLVAVTSEGFQGTTEVRKVASALNVAGLSKLR